MWQSYDDLGGTIGTDCDILVSRSTDNGATWTVPVALNTNAATDSTYDEIPQVTTDGAGNWVVVWESWDDLGGTIGTDCDILFSRSEFGAGAGVPVGGSIAVVLLALALCVIGLRSRRKESA